MLNARDASGGWTTDIDINEYAGSGSAYWPTTSGNILGYGSTITTGMYTYQFDTGGGSVVTRNHIFALLHEILHANDYREDGDMDLSDTDINTMVTNLLNDPTVSAAFNTILTNYPSQGLIINGQGLQE